MGPFLYQGIPNMEIIISMFIISGNHIFSVTHLFQTDAHYNQSFQHTVNVLYLASAIFGGQCFFKFKQVSVDLNIISVFLNMTILIHIRIAFSDALDLAKAAFSQIR